MHLEAFPLLESEQKYLDAQLY